MDAGVLLPVHMFSDLSKYIINPDSVKLLGLFHLKMCPPGGCRSKI